MTDQQQLLLMHEAMNSLILQASDITALVAVEGQVAILQRAHSMLSSHLVLDSWAQIWAVADGQQGFDSTSSRVAHAVTAHVIGDLLPNFAYSEPTQRFTRLVSCLLFLVVKQEFWLKQSSQSCQVLSACLVVT